jgi:hypothetical protein
MALDAETGKSQGDVFLDARGNGRAMRLSWHPEADVVVLSLWREETCAGTFRMPHEDVEAFIDALVDNLRDAPGVHLPPRSAAASTTSDSGDQREHDALGETQAMPAPAPRIGFTDWAFGSGDVGGHANAS